MRRRYLLEIIANAFKWLVHSFTYLYNSLVPTTIDSKNVLDKARIKKIYANGVIENQLLQDFTATNYWAITTGTLTNISNTESVFTLNNDAQYNSGLAVYTNTIVGHKYLLLATLKTSVDNANCNFRQDDNYLFFNSTTQYKQYTWIHEGTGKARMFCLGLTSGTTGDTMTIKNCMVIDLTLMFGTGNEPTALTDNRIQKILNSGYIANNAGSYKGTDIREFSTTKVDTTSLATLSFIYQGNGALNSHDTLEITSSEYVFTKNNSSYTFNGNESWIAWGDAYRTITTSPLAISSNNGNLLCTVLSYADRNKLYDNRETKGIDSTQVAGSTNFMIGSDTYNNVSQLTGATVYYPLATPQVIRIPRKHLGIVDLGSLSWSYSGGSFSANLDHYHGGVGQYSNLYCAKYIERRAGGSYDIDNAIFSANTSYIRIRDDSFNGDTTAFKNSLSNQYLYYETQDEVADIPITLDIEAGGTITSDSDVLPNVDFDIKCK